jgi:hypothetical protein
MTGQGLACVMYNITITFPIIYLIRKNDGAGRRSGLDPAPRTGLHNDAVDREPNQMQPNIHLSPAEAASKLGVSAKALRVYERHGLVKPVRGANGYRAYGPAEMVRLHQVLALKALGLPLSKIAGLLAGRYSATIWMIAARQSG